VRLKRDEIAALIPHAGAMCLLDGVMDWDAERIRCVSSTHRDASNPLRVSGQLPAICGIEYAAQAMAAHGGLAGKTQRRPRAGFLATVRDVICHRGRLDDLEGDLVVEAVRMLGEENRVIYEFRLWVGEMQILSGRAAVVLDSDGAAV
jgi:predicted hotdog family 3-hydroxylacyl-ACP dehydratase